jgi:hypothetical protein
MKNIALPLRLALVPAACGIIATLVYLLQGGFGGGHLRFDPLIAALILPLSLFSGLYERMPLPKLITQYDLLLVIWFPSMINAFAFFLTGIAINACACGSSANGRRSRR